MQWDDCHSKNQKWNKAHQAINECECRRIELSWIEWLGGTAYIRIHATHHDNSWMTKSWIELSGLVETHPYDGLKLREKINASYATLLEKPGQNNCAKKLDFVESEKLFW